MNDADESHTLLLKLGGAAAIMVAFLTVAEIIIFIVFPPPNTISDWYILFQTNPMVGIVDFWGLELPMYAMFAFVFLALYHALKQVNKSGMAIALTFTLVGIAIFFATNNPFSMLALSRKYFAAATDLNQSIILAAGEAVLANTNQRAVGGFNIGLFLVSISGLVTSMVMLRSSYFKRWIASTGIVAFGLSLADYLRQAITGSEIIALLVILPGALFLVAWFLWVGVRLLQLNQIRN